MKNKIKVSPKAKLSVKVIIYATASLALIGVIAWLMFFSLNMGNTEEAIAAPTTYNSVQTGNWNSNPTWGGNSPAMADFSDIANINSNTQVSVPGNLSIKNGAQITVKSNAKLTINGDMIVMNNLVLTVIGELVINGKIDVQNGANVTVNASGKITTTGNVTLQNNANFIVDGIVNVGGNISFGNNANFNGGGTVNVVGTGCSNWAGPGTCNENLTLPVQLISFVVAHHPQGVKISWETASEENNDFFTVEQSVDGINYKAIGEVKGQGTVKTTSSYEFIDEHPSAGRSYYRLTQTDYDSKSETFRPTMIEFESEEEISFVVYPNPFTGSVLNVKFSHPTSGTVEVLDGKGNKILMQNILSNETGMQLNLNENIEPGQYYVNFKTSSFIKTVKAVKR